MVVALGELLGQVFGEDIMASRGQAVAAHAAIVALLVGGLSRGTETHYDVARADVGVVDDVAPAHAAGHGRIDDDRPHEVADVGRLATCGPNTYPHLAHLSQQVVRAVDDGRDDFARDEHLVASDGRGDQDVVHGAHTEQVVRIHDDGVLGNALPDVEVSRTYRPGTTSYPLHQRA